MHIGRTGPPACSRCSALSISRKFAPHGNSSTHARCLLAQPVRIPQSHGPGPFDVRSAVPCRALRRARGGVARVRARSLARTAARPTATGLHLARTAAAYAYARAPRRRRRRGGPTDPSIHPSTDQLAITTFWSLFPRPS